MEHHLLASIEYLDVNLGGLDGIDVRTGSQPFVSDHGRDAVGCRADDVGAAHRVAGIVDGTNRDAETLAKRVERHQTVV